MFLKSGFSKITLGTVKVRKNFTSYYRFYNWLGDALRQKNNLPPKKYERWRLSIIMLTNEQCKKILKKEGFFYTDEEIELIKETLYKLVEIIEKNKINN